MVIDWNLNVEKRFKIIIVLNGDHFAPLQLIKKRDRGGSPDLFLRVEIGSLSQ